MAIHPHPELTGAAPRGNETLRTVWKRYFGERWKKRPEDTTPEAEFEASRHAKVDRLRQLYIAHRLEEVSIDPTTICVLEQGGFSFYDEIGDSRENGITMVFNRRGDLVFDSGDTRLNDSLEARRVPEHALDTILEGLETRLTV